MIQRIISVAVFMSWAAAMGCSDAGTEQSQEACPTTIPEIGAACDSDVVCLYDGTDKLDLGEFDCSQRELACRDGEFQNTGLHCDPAPEATECPATLPTAGTSCSGDVRCLYDAAGNHDSGEFDCSQTEYVCQDGSFSNSGLHCDPA
jgi:hypothetical protein